MKQVKEVTRTVKLRKVEDESEDSEIDPEKFIELNCRFAPDEGEEMEEENKMQSIEEEEEDKGSFQNGSSESNNKSLHEMQDNQDEEYDDETDSYGQELSKRSMSNRHLVPIQFAKDHIQKIENDMKRMHERHVNLMREMDNNYKMIEQETQEYYVEFLQKWKEVAKNKITQYRKAIENLANEKENLAKQKDQVIDNLNDRYTQLLKEKENVMRDYNESIQLRDQEIENIQLEHQSQLQRKDKTIDDLKSKLDNKDIHIGSLEQEIQSLKDSLNSKQDEFENEIDKIQKENEDEINQLQQKYNQKVQDNSQLQTQIDDFKKQIEELQQKLQKQQNTSILSSSGGGSSNPLKIKVLNQNKLNIFNKIQAQSEGRNTQNQQQVTNAQNESQQQNKLIRFKNFKKDQIKVANKNLESPNEQNQNQSNIQVPNVSNYSTQPSNLNLNEDIKAKEQEITKQYQCKIQKLEQEKYPYYAKLVEFQKQYQAEHGKKPKINKQDPIYQDWEQHNNYVKEIKRLTEEKQQKLENLRKNDQEEVQRSARNSKSLSPRRYSMLKQNQYQQQQQNKQNETQDYEQRLQQLMEENQQLKKEIDNLQESNSIIHNFQQVSNNFQGINHEIKEELNNLRYKQLDKLNDLDIKNQIHKLTESNGQLQNSLEQLALKQKKLLEVYKNQTQQLNQIKKKNNMTQQENQSMLSNINEEVNSSINQVNQSKMTDISLGIGTTNHSILNENQYLEQQIEEKLKKRFETEINQLKQQVEQAKQGIIKRDEAIDKLKKLKRQLTQDIENLKKEYSGYSSTNEQLKKQVEELKNESKIGEQLLINQIKDLRIQNERLYEKYDYETLQRKKLHNIIEDMKGKIRVFCRVRPMSDQEKKMGYLEVVKVVDQLTCKLRLKRDSNYLEDSKQGRLKGQQGAPEGSGYFEKEFNFDSCFSPKGQQQDVFEDTKMLIQSAVDGFNVCLFAYGQTGSGKTYTIQGTQENPGLIPKSIEELFLIKQRMEKNDHYTVKLECYMVELYLDHLNDMLNYKQPNQQKAQKLEIREDPQSGMVYIQNVTKKQISSSEEAYQVYETGLINRKTAHTDMNDVSSRSHMIYSIVVETTNNETQQKFKGKLSFVDLAGSERVSKSNPNMQRLKEGQAINLSLKALGDVISNLYNGSHRAHIPYRDNKLTYLMKDSLGGNSKTLMFVNVSPADYNSQETKMSLFFGVKVKSIQNDVHKNIESEELQKLKEENEQLKKSIASVNTFKSTAASRSMLKNQ